ncbi:unnamed protein product [Phaedon cochleariae]|uniref:Uncharacterized protein n=1 Tax=Phaedon cochleariae TaxID=80249 RepID=A0A9N9X5X8_PHACE|nr:unnamed protein product [Phaedon cochleariae]
MSKNNDFLKSSRLKEEVFNIMCPDDISLTAKNYPLVCLYAEALLNKHKRKQIANVLSNKMREMGRLMKALKTIDGGITGLFDALKPENFQSFISTTKIISGSKANDKSFDAPLLAPHMETDLKFVCNSALKNVLENRQLPHIQWTDRQKTKNDIKDLKKLIKGHWCTEISSLALKALKEKHWEKPVQLPSNSDIQIFKTYVNNLAENAYHELRNNLNLIKNYKILTECVLAETLMFNRKRVGEIQYLLIDNYNRTTENVNQESFMDSLTKVEQLISKRFKRVVAGGKGFKPVPILFSKRVQQYVDCILRVRSEFEIVPKSNPYLFANPDSEDRWMSGASVIRKFAQRCSAKEPSLLTSTIFWKHIATTLQLMSMENYEMEQIATFMGHTKKTHMEFYRRQKSLLLLEKGKKKEFKGKSLGDIELDADVYYTTGSENENEGSDDGQHLSERILKKVGKRPRHTGGTTDEVQSKSGPNFDSTADEQDQPPYKENLKKQEQVYTSHIHRRLSNVVQTRRDIQPPKINVLEKLIPRISEANNQVSSSTLDALVGKLAPKIGDMIKNEMDKLIEKFDHKLNNVVTKLTSMEKSIHDNSEEITVINEKLDSLEQNAKMKKLRIIGAAEEQNENLLGKMLKLITEDLGIKCTPEEISDVYRVGEAKNSNSKPRATIIEFVTMLRRNEVFKAKGLLKGKHIFINEDLTHKRYNLQINARKKFGRDVWTRSGRIYAKCGSAVKTINNEADLKD